MNNSQKFQNTASKELTNNNYEEREISNIRVIVNDNLGNEVTIFVKQNNNTGICNVEWKNSSSAENYPEVYYYRISNPQDMLKKNEVLPEKDNNLLNRKNKNLWNRILSVLKK
jgi:hypothetical protein